MKQTYMQLPQEENWKQSESLAWQAFRQGNKAAYAYLYRTHVKVLFNYGMQVCADADVVKDSIQEVFINLWRNRGNLSETEQVKFYLFKALRRQIIKALQTNKKQQAEGLHVMHDRIIGEPSHEARLMEEESSQKNLKKLSAAMGKLPERQREIIYLIYYKNIPHEEAATIMAISLQSVYTLLWKAIKSLKKHIKETKTLLLLLAVYFLF